MMKYEINHIYVEKEGRGYKVYTNINGDCPFEGIVAHIFYIYDDHEVRCPMLEHLAKSGSIEKRRFYASYYEEVKHKIRVKALFM